MTEQSHLRDWLTIELFKNFWRRLHDQERCAYSDCQHPPVRSEQERVTCPICREWTGLPRLEKQ